MLMHFSRIWFTVLLLYGAALFSQEKLDIFGYFQANFTNHDLFQSSENAMFGIKQVTDEKQNAFTVQQLNLFFRKDINDDLTAWINFELANSFSSARSWGDFNLEEAWLKYHHNNFFKLKAGLLIPEFNNLNSVKNRTPYLPYILRPLVYESSISELFTLGDFYPERAYLQFYGSIPFGNMHLNYTVYVGNSETEYHNTDAFEYVTTGRDTSEFLLGGGRIGIQSSNLKLGISFSHDHDNQNAAGLGDVARRRLGADFSSSLYNFTIESEYIKVFHDLDIPNVNLDKTFYYLTFGYQFCERLFGCATFNYIDDAFSPFFKNGLKAFYFGASYRINESVLLKVQYSDLSIDKLQVEPPIVPIPMETDFSLGMFAIAASVSF